ncbi:ARM repeat-containing protein [Schizophyllum commune Loenen D]|nr:ARM repeat-containing protein [Schizophyllum commune Loenen D]
MDYLKTWGSAAVSTIVSKSGLNLPFTLGPKVYTNPIWTLYEGTKRDDGSQVSIFEYDFSDNSRRNTKPLAKNALRKLRTTRHPDVLKFMEVVESETSILLMTERVVPLQTALANRRGTGAQEKEDWLVWGLHRISVALAFLNDTVGSTHGHLRPDSVLISPSGEWKLGGFELLSNPTEESPVLYTMGGLAPDANTWASPEVQKSGWEVLKSGNPAALDAYDLGLLIHILFNPDAFPPATASPPHPPPNPSSRGAIPNSIFPSYKRLLNPNPGARLTPKGFLEIGMGSEKGFFAGNRLVQVCSGLDNFALSSEADKATLLKSLKDSAGSFPTEFVSHRILPALVSALEFGGASAASILPLVLQFGKNVPPKDYPDVILAPLVKLYASPDRGTRMALLEHLPEYAEHLDKKTVDQKIFVYLKTGFDDTVAVIREATVKSLLLLAPKLSDRTLNNDLLRYLAKMQQDPEPSIRTNTCILIGRLAPSLGYNTKRKVLVPAFTRALKDAFVHCRVAGLMALMATSDCFDAEEVATKVIPNMSFAMVDKERLVRDQAFKAMELYVKKLEKHAETMPESVLPPPGSPEALAAANGSSVQAPSIQYTMASTAAGAAGSLAGWAMSSITSRVCCSCPGGHAIHHRLHCRPSDLCTAAARRLSERSISSQRQARERPPWPFSRKLGCRSCTDANFAAWPENEGHAAWCEQGARKHLGRRASARGRSGTSFETAPPVHAPKPTVAAAKPKPMPVDDGWGAMDDTAAAAEDADDDPWASPAPQPNLTTSRPKPKPVKAVPSLPKAVKSISWQATPVSSPSPPPATPSTPSMSTMSKEEKAAEMARRKEERRLRIAALKEQKKQATAGK